MSDAATRRREEPVASAPATCWMAPDHSPTRAEQRRGACPHGVPDDYRTLLVTLEPPLGSTWQTTMTGGTDYCRSDL
jgi:hypothetical protein